MKLHLKDRNPVRLAVTLSVSGNAVIRIKGYDKRSPDTVYFDRQAGSGDMPVSGQFTLYFHFPFPFGHLGIVAGDVKGKTKVRIVSIKPEPLTSKKLSLQGPARAFIGFAKWFAYTSGTLPANTYVSKDRQFTVRYLDLIRDHESGAVIDTPARVNHLTGVIEVCRRDFLKLSVVNRLYILMHEYTHFANKTTDEVECDLAAALTLMDLGYDRMETLNSVGKLFLFNGTLPAGQRTEQERRVGMVKSFVERYAAS